MSNFSFSHSVFERFVSRRRQKVSLCGNGLRKPCSIKHFTTHDITLLWIRKSILSNNRLHLEADRSFSIQKTDRTILTPYSTLFNKFEGISVYPIVRDNEKGICCALPKANPIVITRHPTQAHLYHQSWHTAKVGRVKTLQTRFVFKFL